MISKAMQDAINEQIKNEMYSSNIYLAMAAHFDAANLPGSASWMKLQAEEEREHAMRFYAYLTDQGARVQIGAMDAPPAEFKSVTSVFEETLKHEQKVTAMIHALYDLALKEKDYPSQVMLQWFINEQVEEEKNASEIVEHLKFTGEAPMAVMMLDRQLGKRKEE